MTFLGPVPADETAAQGVVYVTVTCFNEGAEDAVARSEQAARDASQTVTERDDLGDGGFAATDENGSNFIQLRHDDVVVYLAGSSAVAGTDVDTIASAYDKALGGDGGAVAVGTVDPGPSASEEPLASDLPSEEARPLSRPRPSSRRCLPATLDGTPLTVSSLVGTDLFGDAQGSRAIVAALRAAGKTPADLKYADAYDESGALDISMFAVAIDGLSDAKTKAMVLDSWLTASGAGVTQTPVDARRQGRDEDRLRRRRRQGLRHQRGRRDDRRSRRPTRTSRRRRSAALPEAAGRADHPALQRTTTRSAT